MPIAVGSYHLHPGYRIAGSDDIHIRFEGVSGHSSSPHLAKESFLPATTFVTQLDRQISKFNEA